MVFSFLHTQQQEGTFACHLIQSVHSEPWVGSYCVYVLSNTGSYRVLGPTGWVWGLHQGGWEAVHLCFQRASVTSRNGVVQLLSLS